jgi:hypothetical protein
MLTVTTLGERPGPSSSVAFFFPDHLPTPEGNPSDVLGTKGRVMPGLLAPLGCLG